MANIDMRELTGKPHKFFSRHAYRNDPELRRFLDDKWVELKASTDQITGESMEYREDNGQKMQEFQWSYNMFTFYNEKLHNVLGLIRDMVIEACDYYNIDYKAEKYYITSWMNYTKGPKVVYEDQLKFDDHGSHPKEFHGYYAIDAEPGVTYYKLDDDVLFPHENENGKILLSLNGYHHGVGTWTPEKNRVTIAYNIMPLSRVPRDRSVHGQHIPLL